MYVAPALAKGVENLTRRVETSLSERERELVKLDDATLVSRVYDAIRGVDDKKTTSNDLYYLVGEIMERWAPAVEWQDTLAYAQRNYDPKQRRKELESARDYFVARAQARAAAIATVK